MLNFKTMRYIIIFLSLICLFGNVIADNSPLLFNGYFLMSNEPSLIQIMSAKVDINELENNLFTIKASYVLINKSQKAINLKVGFPIGEVLLADKYNLITTLGLYQFSIVQNNLPIVKKERIDSMSYGWNAAFTPGLNNITVEYKISASLSAGNQRFYNVRYLLSAGTLANEPIDTVAITIYMLKPIDKEQLKSVSPGH